MPAALSLGAGPLDTIALALVATALVGALERRLAIALGLLAVQGALLTAAALLMALDGGGAHGYFAVGITFAIKLVAIPATLYPTVRDVARGPAPRLAVSHRTALVLALLVALAAFYVVEPITPPGLHDAGRALAAAVAVMLLGLFTMMIQGRALAQVLALVTMENGIYLAALAATRGFPLAVELGVALDALVAVAVMTLVSRQIHREFEGTDTGTLRSLRG